jgi:hypothetical protein
VDLLTATGGSPSDEEGQMKRCLVVGVALMFILTAVGCPKQQGPSEAEARAAIAEACQERFPGWDPMVEIEQIGEYDETNECCKVYASAGVTAGGTYISVGGVDHFLISKDSSGEWVARIVYKEE